MSQNENKPENTNNQVEPEVTEQEQSSELNKIADTTSQTSHVDVEPANADVDQTATEDAVQTTLQQDVVAPVKASSTGWKVATGILAAAVIGLLIYTFVPSGNTATVATVNGDKISQADLLDKLVQYNHTYVNDLVESIIDEKVVEQELKAKNITVTDADLAAEMAAFRLQYPDQADFESLLSYYGMTEEDLTNNLKQSTQIRLLLNDNITITDEQIQEYFDTNKASLGAHGERVRASHILVSDEELAKDIIAQLDQGADFATLAAQYGTDATAQTGGDLGLFEKGEMVAEFSDAAFAMELNTYTKEPVKTDYGFHVILKTEEEAAYEPTLDNLKDAIKVELVNTEIYAQYPTYVDDLRAKGKVNNTFDTVYPSSATTEVQ